ncbi:unnamed protein product, partial [Tilletia laevis]
MSSVQEWVKADSGQWKLSIPGELLLELVELGFRDADIAIMLDCSPGTIYRRRKEMGIEKWNTSIDEQALIEHLVKLRSMHSDTVGERGTMGALNSLGIRVSRSKLRTAIKALDPIGVTSRWTKYLKRREYYVPFVNSLWHIDGHHKLIRWKIVIHGAIDGKSRLV